MAPTRPASSATETSSAGSAVPRPLPAQQGLVADPLGGAEIDDGLVVKRELALAERPPERLLHVEPLQHGPPHPLLEDDEVPVPVPEGGLTQRQQQVGGDTTGIHLGGVDDAHGRHDARVDLAVSRQLDRPAQVGERRGGIEDDLAASPPHAHERETPPVEPHRQVRRLPPARKPFVELVGDGVGARHARRRFHHRHPVQFQHHRSETVAGLRRPQQLVTDRLLEAHLAGGYARLGEARHRLQRLGAGSLLGGHEHRPSSLPHHGVRHHLHEQHAALGGEVPPRA
jgi:hypothetical protein